MFKLIFLVAALVAISSGDTIRTTVETDQWLNDRHCCNGDTIDRTELDRLIGYGHECSNKIWGTDGLSLDVFNCDRLREAREQTVCLVECTGRKMGSNDNNGNIKRDAVIRHLKNLYKDTEWKVRATERIVDKCIASLTKDTDTVEEGKCNRSAIKFLHCVWKEFICTCPRELRNDRLRCTKLREHLEKDDVNNLKTAHFLQIIRLLELEHDSLTNVVRE